MQCDKCRKWRVVEHTSLAALRPEEYGKRRSGCVEVDWGRWLSEARKRYDEFVQRHSGQDAALEQEIAGGGLLTRLWVSMVALVRIVKMTSCLPGR